MSSESAVRRLLGLLGSWALFVLGFGWVSILDPARMVEILDVPLDWHLIGHLCLGYPETETKIPELERAEWENRKLPSKAIIGR